MALRGRTKRLLADTLKEMLSRMPLEKVRIEELCQECGIDRRTFYYHFKDKYDLVAWIYQQDYEAALRDTGGRYSEELIQKVLQRMNSHRAFYRKAFLDKSQNTITRYIHDFYMNLYREKILAHTGGENLSEEELYDLGSYVYASVEHTKEWLEGTSAYSIPVFARLQYRSLPSFLREAVFDKDMPPESSETPNS